MITLSLSSLSAVATSTQATPTATASAADTCTVSPIPTTTECLNGYYEYDGYYYQVIRGDNVRSYAGFSVPNSQQDETWGCIEFCSMYSSSIGTFWFPGLVTRHPPS
ncbi:uncharacterized protein BO97DRAFT_423079 [Aspergillus homomorphus CBS 101889]|uniref:Uncharacterized protein n=1 Tax=Aspergillus homomorphus (strain CBS 101889) TaxID=1450537 RepID=A0A395I3H2_ASPHC|nr:hypothetical protein BO97DRAFT_423079 [Aspergillus homomorphus CBS 101889]RAL14163.1 hypothetical protein BO97DRAFT_423079 [Aspergillus homomorphus CBS 101889]